MMERIVFLHEQSDKVGHVRSLIQTYLGNDIDEQTLDFLAEDIVLDLLYKEEEK